MSLSTTYTVCTICIFCTYNYILQVLSTIEDAHRIKKCVLLQLFWPLQNNQDIEGVDLFGWLISNIAKYCQAGSSHGHQATRNPANFVAKPCKIGLAMINGAILYLERRGVLATRNGDARDLDEKYCNIRTVLTQITSKNIKVWVRYIRFTF